MEPVADQMAPGLRVGDEKPVDAGSGKAVDPRQCHGGRHDIVHQGDRTVRQVFDPLPGEMLQVREPVRLVQDIGGIVELRARLPKLEPRRVVRDPARLVYRVRRANATAPRQPGWEMDNCNAAASKLLTFRHVFQDLPQGERGDSRMKNVVPVVLCGGVGTRLWPLSRKSYPKQFVPLIGEKSLFQACAERMVSDADVTFSDPLILTNSDFRFIVTEQLQEVGINPGAVLIEPEGRNTAPAILAAALHVAQTDPDAILLVAPSDHVLPDVGTFRAAVARGVAAIEAQPDLVTFGITPDRPETGYGYLELAAVPDGSGAVVPLSGFVEKPEAAAAQAMLEDGRYLWNSGIFLFAAKDIIAAFEEHAADLVGPVRASVARAQGDLGFLRLDPEAWAAGPTWAAGRPCMNKAAPTPMAWPGPGRSPRSTAATACCARKRRIRNWSAWGWTASSSSPCPTRCWWRIGTGRRM